MVPKKKKDLSQEGEAEKEKKKMNSMYGLNVGETIEERAIALYLLTTMEVGVYKEVSIMNGKTFKNPIPDAIIADVPEAITFTDKTMPPFDEFLKIYQEFGTEAATGCIILDVQEEKRISITSLNEFPDLVLNFVFDETPAEVDLVFNSFEEKKKEFWS